LKEVGKQDVKEMVRRCENYREVHNIHGDEQINYEKRKHNSGMEMGNMQWQKINHTRMRLIRSR